MNRRMFFATLLGAPVALKARSKPTLKTYERHVRTLSADEAGQFQIAWSLWRASKGEADLIRIFDIGKSPGFWLRRSPFLDEWVLVKGHSHYCRYKSFLEALQNAHREA